jgi:hypothetical protein
MRSRRLNYSLLAMAILAFISVHPLMAQSGRLTVRVVPQQAYIFVDGNPVVDADHHFVIMDAGEHKIDLYNYGYKPESRTVTIEAGKRAVLDVTMQAIPGTVPGPWGCITVEGATHDAVLLNGKDPAFFVGNGGEFDHEWMWKRELIVPPGKYELTVMHGDPVVWTTTVDVPVNQRVIVDAYKGVRTTVPWSRGQHLGSLPRFKASFASIQVAVQQVTGQFSASTGQISCGDSARLTWSSDGAVRNEISGVGPVGASGDQTVQPKQTTDYKFTAAGPGGIYSSDATVNVNSAVEASLSVSPAEVRYHKIGDKVDQTGSATVTWSAGNADTVTVDPFGSVATSGNRTIQIAPSKTSVGPIDETVTYTLHAGNACGGSETRTATLHIVGSIDAMQTVDGTTFENKLSTLSSLYFPYNLPTPADPQGGLVPSQEREADELASDFKQYLEFRPEAHLILEGHADRRGSSTYNMALSQRRADRVKNYLVEHGVPAQDIETQAFGKGKNLTNKEVLELANQNTNLSPEDRKHVARNLLAFGLANNRRVDFRLSTTGQTSLRFFPYNADDLNLLLGLRKSAMRKGAQKAPAKQ